VLAPGTYFWRVVIQDHKTPDRRQPSCDPHPVIAIQ